MIEKDTQSNLKLHNLFQVIEKGTHSSLMELQGFYYKLQQTQTQNGENKKINNLK